MQFVIVIQVDSSKLNALVVLVSNKYLQAELVSDCENSVPRKQKSCRVTRALSNTGGALSYMARWENWYAAGNFGQVRL